jgi:ATP-binding protein involved in chromosome partitioning
MSAIACPQCGEEMALFGTGGGEETARRLTTLVGGDVPLMGKVPFNVDLREGGDNGAPVVISAPQSASAQAITEIVEKLVIRQGSLLGVRLGLA